MRPIKFRGKRTDNNQWIADSSIIVDDEICDRIGIMDTTEGMFVDVYPDTVGQYTGLRDRNGKEIYEGDILNNYDEPNPLVVRWDEARCCFALYDQDGDVEYFDWLEVRLGVVVDAEVVSNIHDNPELLKQNTKCS